MRHQTKPLSVARAVASTLILVAPALVWTCNPPAIGVRPECPGEDSLHLVVPLSGTITGIPEFHDCQRFIVVRNGDVAYDSLYAIFASFSLDSLPSQATGSVAIAAATVYSYEGTYSQLGIHPRFNCLYLWDPQNWKAKMVPATALQDTDCTAPINPQSVPGKVLPVRVASNPQVGPSDYPPVARWDWDSVHRNQYIGIKCGGAWCEIGDSGFVPSQVFGKLLPADPAVQPPPTQLEIYRVSNIKGWYDAQLLAVTGQNGRLRPSAVWGTFVPNPQLNRIEDLVTFQNFWVHVGTVILSGDLSTYKTKFNFAGSGQLTKLYVCHGGQVSAGQGGGCEMANAPQPTCPTQPDTWWAKIVSNTGTMYKCLTRRQHPNASTHIPGTVRWRWVVDDEGTWNRCTGGCCAIPH